MLPPPLPSGTQGFWCSGCLCHLTAHPSGLMSLAPAHRRATVRGGTVQLLRYRWLARGALCCWAGSLAAVAKTYRYVCRAPRLCVKLYLHGIWLFNAIPVSHPLPVVASTVTCLLPHGIPWCPTLQNWTVALNDLNALMKACTAGAVSFDVSRSAIRNVSIPCIPELSRDRCVPHLFRHCQL